MVKLCKAETCDIPESTKGFRVPGIEPLKTTLGGELTDDMRTFDLLAFHLPRVILSVAFVAVGAFGGATGLQATEVERASGSAERRSATAAGLPEGLHLYGQVPEPGVLGREYLVLQVEGDRAIGAVYLPRSEFSCFSGVVGPRQLELTIDDDYTRDSYPYAIALVPVSPLASSGAPTIGVGLQGYHRLDAPSVGDLSILNSCRRRAGEF